MEVKELFELIGFEAPEEGDVKLEDVRSHVNSTFVPVNQLEQRNDLIEPIISKAVGSRLGKLETNYIKQLKGLGVEVSHSDFEGKGVEGVIDGGLERIKALIADKSKGAKPNDELEAKLAAIAKERDAFQQSTAEWQDKYNGLETSIQQEKENAIKNSAIQGAFAKVKYPANTNEVTKNGLRAMFLENYGMEQDNGTVYVTYKSGENKGSRVQHPKNAAKLMTVEDAVETFAKEQGLWSDSPHEGKATVKPTVSAPRRDPNNPAQKTRQASSTFLSGGLG